MRDTNVAVVRQFLHDDPGLVWADHLFLLACRVPGYEGHGGRIDPKDANEKNRAKIVRLFVGYGAHPSARNNRKVSPLHMAARFGLKTVAETLLDCGADPNATDVVRETPLYRAMNLGYPDVAKVLLKSGADPNVSNRKGHTPLH